MTSQDFFIAPIFFLILTFVIYILKFRSSIPSTKKYFIPALMIKFGGAVAVGLVYQFYYGGGDTFAYHTHGSRWIWRAFQENPLNGLSMIFGDNNYRPMEIFQYASRIWYYRDDHSFFVVRVAAFFDLLTFNTYTATALFFAAFSFLGAWSFYQTLTRVYPNLQQAGAYAILFIPSVVFWGSGIFKDSLTLASLFFMFSAVLRFTHLQERNFLNLIWLVFHGFIILSIKEYILLAFICAVTIFLYQFYIGEVKSQLIKTALAPLLLVSFVGVGYFLLNNLGGGGKYSLQNVANTAFITAQDIRYGWGKDGGSGFDIGFDGSIGSMVSLFPVAINAVIFRPYIWEASNPLMLLAAFEALIFTFFTLRALAKSKFKLGLLFKDPATTFFVAFALLFAFSVGISTTNFGTLVRYKIPMMPFYALTLFMMNTRERQIQTSS